MKNLTISYAKFEQNIIYLAPKIIYHNSNYPNISKSDSQPWSKSAKHNRNKYK